MKYLIYPSTGRTDALTLSKCHYEQSCPVGVRSPRDVTTYLGGVIVHPVNDRIALEVPRLNLPVHLLADEERLADCFTLSGEKDEVRAAINSSRNTSVEPETLLPTSTRSALLTESEMRSDGWFPA